MHRLTLLTLLSSMVLGAAAHGDVLVDWDFAAAHNLTTSGNSVPVGLGVTVLDNTEATTDASVTCSDITAESAWEGHPCGPEGLNWSGGGFIEYGELNLQRWDGDTSGGCGSNNDGVNDNYLSFSLTPTGAPIEVTRLSISVWRNGSGAPGTYAMEVIADGGPAISFGTPQIDPVHGDNGFDWFQFDDSVTAATSLEIRFRPAASPGGLGTGNLHINGLLVEEGTGGSDPPEGPNVLFIISDDLAPGALGCYGAPDVQTPNIDALAAQGMVFDRAYCQYPVCANSRSSMLTGLYSERIEVLGGTPTNFDGAIGAHCTLPEHFRLNGWTSARVSKLYHMRIPGDITSGSPGPDHAPSWNITFNAQAPEWMTPGTAGHYTNESLDFSQPTTHYNLGFGASFYCIESSTDGTEQADALSATEAELLLDGFVDENFFLAVGFVRPHVPLIAPANKFALYDPTQLPLADSVPGDLNDIPSAGIYWNEPVRGPNTDDDRRHVLQAYYAAVSFMDEQVGRVLTRLETLGLLDETIVVFTSDHGYHLGEHTMWQKLSLHEESARVPLIIAGPGIAPGRTGALAELIDLYPTLADLSGLTVPAACQGKSLRPLLEGTATSVRSAALSSVSNGHLLRTEDWAYMRYSNGTEELYDMAPAPAGDPLQFTNLVGDSSYASTLLELRGLLDTKLLVAMAGPNNAYCFGDGTGAACPCSVWGGLGEGCANSTGVGAGLAETGSLSASADDLGFSGTGLLPSQAVLLFVGNNALGSGNGAPFGDGLRCAGGSLLRLGIQMPDASGAATWGPGLGALGGWVAGDTRYFQLWYRDPVGGPCGSGFNLTNGVGLTLQS